MPTDYKSHGRQNEKKPLPGFVWLLIGLSLGLFVALIIYLDRQPASDISFGEAVQQELDKLRKQDTAPTQQQAEEPGDDDEPTFNFYTILPELEVLIPESEIQMEQKADSPAGAKPGSGKQYILQAGSFKSHPDADKLKASLALLGLEAGIQSVSINGEKWHRVRVGPYDNKRDVYQGMNRLQQHGINAMAVEIKPE